LLFVIEHLEPEVGRWLYIEYMHSSEIVGKSKIMFTNVKNRNAALLLSKLGKTQFKSFAEIFNPEEVVILDPQAQKLLTPEDFKGKRAVIIGGILGDHPPRGRTRKFLTAKFPKATVRNIGREQFSIDGAVYVAKLVSEGKRLDEIPIMKGLTVKLNEYAEIYLPYAYPLRDGKPVIHKELIEYLRSEEIVQDEERILKRALFPSEFKA